jgi:hypothetical protein
MGGGGIRSCTWRRSVGGSARNNLEGGCRWVTYESRHGPELIDKTSIYQSVLGVETKMKEGGGKRERWGRVLKSGFVFGTKMEGSAWTRLMPQATSVGILLGDIVVGDLFGLEWI